MERVLLHCSTLMFREREKENKEEWNVFCFDLLFLCVGNSRSGV